MQKKASFFQNDDDVIIPKKSIKNVIDILEKNPQIGLVTGKVNNKSPLTLKHILLYALNSFLRNTKIFNDYLITINDIGLFSINFDKIHTILFGNKNYYTLSPIGSSMALRKIYIEKFKIPEITKRSINNETFIALVYKKLNFDILYYPNFNVITNTNYIGSLSRPKNKGLNVLEIYLLPIYVYESGYDIKLKELIKLKEYLQQLPNITPYKEYIIKGLELSINYLTGNLTMKRIYDIVDKLSCEYS
ncbi:hypothetical protein [Saccharolobus islandicus]|uniref:hypothetical protein n=1 Tax=Saccharolobus islandicus TaxID=43080 RepID=UPI000379EB03|nr:hypothetical protein [Sulfolobus islandicus]